MAKTRITWSKKIFLDQNILFRFFLLCLVLEINLFLIAFEEILSRNHQLIFEKYSTIRLNDYDYLTEMLSNQNNIDSMIYFCNLHVLWLYQPKNQTDFFTWMSGNHMLWTKFVLPMTPSGPHSSEDSLRISLVSFQVRSK